MVAAGEAAGTVVDEEEEEEEEEGRELAVERGEKTIVEAGAARGAERWRLALSWAGT